MKGRHGRDPCERQDHGLAAWAELIVGEGDPPRPQAVVAGVMELQQVVVAHQPPLGENALGGIEQVLAVVGAG